MRVITCIAPVNIAVIKYWGKRDEELILPINDSISCTLSMDQMCAKTTIMASPDFKENKFWLNGEEQDLESPRLTKCFKKIQEAASLDEDAELVQWNIRICSENNFPTAAGLASSAAGYACLITALAALYNLNQDLSGFARLGSGSACRSVYGGWVQWYKGEKPDGSDSIAKVIKPYDHWPQMRIIVLVVNDGRKKYSSTAGMKTSVETSELLKFRAQYLVPRRVDEMRKAIIDQNFNKFAEITMKDSNQFHSICLDTFPPCVYMNDVSHAIIEMVQTYNDYKKETKVAYTFDAGPNACLYLLENDVNEVFSLINTCFPTDKDDSEYRRGIPLVHTGLSKACKSKMNLVVHKKNLLKYLIYTRVGEGPQVLTDPNEHLLSEAGMPKNLA